MWKKIRLVMSAKAASLLTDYDKKILLTEDTLREPKVPEINRGYTDSER